MTAETSIINGVVFDKIEDVLEFMGCKPDMSPKAQAERAAWQDEAAMSPRQRREAYEARLLNRLSTLGKPGAA